MTPEEFYETYSPYAARAASQAGVDPRLVLAQAALETGYGRSAPNYNFFGIKSHGRSGGQDLATTEVENGRDVRRVESFRGYSNPRESFDDYAAFLLENPRYEDVLAADTLDEQIEAMGRSGYATDPEYANKLRSISARFTGTPSTPEARRAQYGLGDRDPGNAAEIVGAVSRGDMTKDEAQKFVSEELLEGIEGGSAYDQFQEGDRDRASLGVSELRDFAALTQQPQQSMPSFQSLSRYGPRLSGGRPSATSGTQALKRMGVGSLLSGNPLLGMG